MPFCEKCGSKTSDSSKFCHNCGSSIVIEKDSQDYSIQNENRPNNITRIDDDATKQEKLIRLLLKKYVNEYIFLLIISSIVSVASYAYYLISSSESALSWLVFGLLFVFASSIVLINRLVKQNNLIRILSSNGNSTLEIWAEKQTQKIHRPGMWGNEVNTLVLHVFGKSYEVPEIMLPYTLDECLEIINSKKT